jgi:SIR2-like protein
MPGETHRFFLEVPYVDKTDPVPTQLKEAIAEKKCLLFLGAGASLGATDENGKRLPSWATLIQELLAELDDEGGQVPQPEAQDLFELGELLALSEWLDGNLSRNRFSQYLRRRLGTAQNSPVHDVLSTKNFAAVMTTNYDNLVEDYWGSAGKRPFVVTPHMSESEISLATDALRDTRGTRLPVIKPHGTWERPDSLVFGPRTYRQIIFDNEPFRRFMSTVLTQYTILFVGLSFKDPNLISLLQWVHTQSKGTAPIHYATMENRGQIFKRFMLENHNVRLLTYPVPPIDHSAAQSIFESL